MLIVIVNKGFEMKTKEMGTTLINYRTYKGDKSKVIPIDRRSGFGNPFIINKDGNREKVIKEYAEWLREWVEDEEELTIDGVSNKWIIEHLYLLKGKTLGCWCTPLPCHGDVIIEYLEGLDEQI